MDTTSRTTVASPNIQYPSISTATGTIASAQALKQRRVSLALPSSPKVTSPWNFRDDTRIDSSSGTSASKAADKKTKMRRASGTEAADRTALTGPEKRQRKKWTEEETQMLVNGCNTVRIRVQPECFEKKRLNFFGILLVGCG